MPSLEMSIPSSGVGTRTSVVSPEAHELRSNRSFALQRGHDIIPATLSHMGGRARQTYDNYQSSNSFCCILVPLRFDNRPLEKATRKLDRVDVLRDLAVVKLATMTVFTLSSFVFLCTDFWICSCTYLSCTCSGKAGYVNLSATI